MLPKKELEKDNKFKSSCAYCLLCVKTALCYERYRKEGLFTFRFSGGRLNTGWMDGQMKGCMRNRDGE